MAARLTAYAVAFIVGVTFIAGLIVGAQREDDGAVDLIVINGKVYASDGGAATSPRPSPFAATRSSSRLNREIRGSARADHRGRRQGRRGDGRINDAHAPSDQRRPGARSGHLSDAATIDDLKDTSRMGGVAS